MKPINPIYWESIAHQHAKVVDLRTLPEDTKVKIIKAALTVAYYYDNGEYCDLPEGSEQEKALEAMVDAVGTVSLHMHEVSLVPCH
ncbi:MAG: hypothetical protein QM777_08765 [Pseudorhodoferax sp.]